MNSSRIDIKFAQEGPSCVFASYAIIINYFSDGKESITSLRNRYDHIFNTNPQDDSDFQIEKSINIHYHSYCEKNNLRGFEFIKQQHIKDIFSTSKYCIPKMLAVNTGDEKLPIFHNNKIKKRLKKGGLAMVLYQSGINQFHSIVVGFDKRNGGFFFRNPQQFQSAPLLSRTDFLKNNDIFEYILFERK